MNARKATGGSCRTVRSFAARLALGWVCATLAVAIASPCTWACPDLPPTEEENTPPKNQNPAIGPEPIVFADGIVTESATDAFLPGVTVSWSHGRNYSSALTEGAHIQGVGWKCTWLTTFLRFVDKGEDPDEYELYLNHLCKRVFTSSDGSTFTPPSDYLATLEHIEEDMDEDETPEGYYRLTLTQSGETFYFCDFGEDWEDNEQGLLRYRTDRYRTEWLTYSYNDEVSTGRITSVTTSQGWSVVYSYVDGGPNGGRLLQINVKNGSDQTIQRVKYTYYESDSGYSTDCGDDGDLIMVEVLKRTTANNLASESDEDFSIQQITMYRYFRENDGDGTVHQLKMVLAPASVQAAMTDGSKTTAQLLGLDDDDPVDVDKPAVQDYANVTYTYYTEDFETDSGEDLETKYGGSNIDETGFAESQTVRKDYKGYLGTRTYFYMGNSESSDLNAVQRIVVEDHTEAGTRTVYGLNKDRLALRQVFVDNPDNSPKYWCQSFVMGETAGQNANQVVEKRLPSAHNCIDTTGEVTTFLDVQDTWTSASIMNQSSGVVYVYDYNADGYLIKERVKQGNSNVSTAIYLRVVEYGDGAANRPKYLPWKTYVYHTATTTEATESARFLVTTTYTFHDEGTEQQMEEKTVTREAIDDATQNGSDTAIVTKEYYDDRGRLRWTQDGEGHVNYYSYHQYTGGLGYVMVDVETDDLPAAITDGSSPKWIAWSDAAPFTHADDDSLQLVTKREYDDLGRRIKVEDAESAVTATAYCADGTRVYPGWDMTAHTAALPIRVEKTNKDDLTTEIYTLDPAGVTEGHSSNLPTGVDTGETQDDYVTWTQYAYDDDHTATPTMLLETVDRYHDIPSNGNGTLSTNYYRKFYKYDSSGRRTHTIQVVSGTTIGAGLEQVTMTNYDEMGRVTSVERGVSGTGDDMGSGYASDPTLKAVSAAFFDESTPGSGTSGVGDGLVTSTLSYYDAASAANVVETIFHHNWRGQLRGIVPETAPYTVQDVDNLGRATAVAQYQGVITSWSTVVADPDYAETVDNPNGTVYRGAFSRTYYDEQGRLYRTEVYAVDPSDGSDGDKVVTDNYYDRNSRLAGTDSSGGAGTEVAYDGAGRRTEVRTVKALESTKYSSGIYVYCDPQPDATSGGNEGVLQMTRTAYDDVGNVEKTFVLEMNHDDTTTVGISFTDNDFVRTSTYHWYEPDTHRPVTTAYYGSGDAAWKNASAPAYAVYGSRPSASGATCLVTEFAYDKGRLQTVTNPRDKDTKIIYDDRGRRIYVVENYDNFDESDETLTGDGSDTSKDRVTKFTYDGLSNVLTQVTLDPDANGNTSDKQTTTYTYYDSTRSPYHAGLVTQIQYPDGDTSDDNVKFAYALDGRVKTRTDQKTGAAANVITFDYDVTFRRLTQQNVTTVGTGVDNTVQSITTTYDTALGRVEYVTSHTDSSPDIADFTDALNQVQYTYDNIGRLDKEYQEHEDEVDTETTLYVQYTYAAASGGEYVDGLRLASVRYPDTRIVNYTYGADTSLPDTISRLDAIKDASSNILASYEYNGLGRLVVEDFEQPDVRLDYYNDYDGNPTAGTYEGLDRFGRIKQQVWRDYDAPAYVDHFTYGYDYNSNRLRRKNEHTNGTAFSELYHAENPAAGTEYDGLDRLKEFHRGTLDGQDDGIASDDSGAQLWTLDQVGNWDAFKDDATDGSAWDLEQTRTQTAANEISGISEGGGQSAWADPAYSARGNMTTLPKPSDLTASYAATYDAWNRLVFVWVDSNSDGDHDAGETVIARYEYDALNRRTKEFINADTDDDFDSFRHFYYNAGWQILEIRTTTSENDAPDSEDPDLQYVWSARYIDAPVCRDKDTSNGAGGEPDGDCMDSDDEHLYYTTDANMNVTCLTDKDGDEVERYVYNPYGEAETVYSDDWSTTVATWAASRMNNIRYCGYYFDNETGLYSVRNRYYHVQLGWITRDPAGYSDGMSLYEYVASTPLGATDPMGLCTAPGQAGPDAEGDGSNTAKEVLPPWKQPGYKPEVGDPNEADAWRRKINREAAKNARRSGGRVVGGGGGDGADDWYFGPEKYRDYGNPFAEKKYTGRIVTDETTAQNYRNTFSAFERWQLQPEIDLLKQALEIGGPDPRIYARLQQIQMEIDAAGAYGESSIERANQTALVAIGTMTAAAGLQMAVQMGAVPAAVSAGSKIASGGSTALRATKGAAAVANQAATKAYVAAVTHPATIELGSGLVGGYTEGYGGSSGTAPSPPTGRPFYDLGYYTGNVIGTVQGALGQ